MTITESHIAFKIETDKNANNIGMSGCPSFLPEEIDYWINSAYLISVSRKFTGNNPLQTPFERNNKRIADLEKLVKVDKGITLASEADTNKLIMHDFTSNIVVGSDEQEKRMFFISGILKFKTRTGANANAVVQIINHDQANNFLETYANKPWIENPVAVLEDNSLILFVDRDLMSGPFVLDLTYLAYPNRINHLDITTGMDQIPEYMQYEVIKLAADMAIENIESPRTQTHPQYLSISE